MLEVGIVKTEGISEDFKGIAGMKLLLANTSKVMPEKKEERLVLMPMTKEGFEQYYKEAFEVMGKEMISDDYKYFLEYMLDGNCEFICRIQVNDLKEFREANEDDIKDHTEAFNWFIEKHELCVNQE